jgi:predicted porin
MPFCVGVFIQTSIASAQTSVQIYGVVDFGILYTSKSIDMQTGLNAGQHISAIGAGNYPSIIGFTGSEKLMSTWQVSFKVESGFDSSNGALGNSNGNFWGRQAWIALGGPYGEFKGGLQFSPFFNAAIPTDPRGLSYFGSGLVTYVDNVLSTSILNVSALSYTSPNLGGLTSSFMVAFGGEAGDFKAGRQYSANLIYQSASFTITVAYYAGNAGGTVNTPVPSTIAFVGKQIGVSYQFGKVTAKGSMFNFKTAGSFDNYVIGGGLDYAAAPDILLDAGAYWTRDRNDTKNHSVLFAAGGKYLLSKRSTIYAQVGLVSSGGAMNTGLSINGALFEPAGNTFGATVGLRHAF